MAGELPVCKRCCFCLPLRYGLLTWGYMKLKNVKLLRVFYYYNVGLLVLTILLVALIAVLSLDHILTWHRSVRTVMSHVTTFSAFFVYIVLQTYFLLLLRSEILKLRNNCEFRFVNNAAEAECTMKYDGIADDDTDTEEV